MIVKERIHKLIIQTYYIILKALNKYPSPTELASQAQQAISDGAGKTGELMKEGYGTFTGRVGNVVDSGKMAAERAGVIGNNATEVTKSAEDLASKDAGHLLGNAQEMLGGKIEEVGKGIKGVKIEAGGEARNK